MVVVGTVEIFNMERNARRSRETVEPMFEQFRVHLTQARGREGRLEHQIGPTRNIKRAASPRLIHRSISMAITRDALAVAQRLCHRLDNGDAGVLGRVMLIDMQVAHRLDLYFDERMAGKLAPTMVKRSEEHTSELQSLMRI